MKRKTAPPFFIWICLLALATFLHAQNPPPAPKQTKSIGLINGIAHVGNGKVIENALVGFKDGKITLVADARLIRLQQNAFDTLINLNGQHIYPGLIAANTTLGLAEIEQVRATRDMAETGNINPSARSLIAYNTDSKVIPTVRSNGIMLAQIVPQGGLVSGQSSVVMLDAWNWEDASYLPDAGIHLNWPSMIPVKYPNAPPEEEQKKNMEKSLMEIRQLFEDASAYAKSYPGVVANMHFEAMRGLFDGTKKLFVHANQVKQIMAAIDLSKVFNLKMVVVGGDDAWMITSQLKENNIPVILGRLHSLPSRQDENLDQPFTLPKQLLDAGVKFCLSMEGFWQVRNLPFNAGTAAAYGLSREEALSSVTLWPAEILGISSTTGTLEEGKDATLFVSGGDALDMRSNKISAAFIQGRSVNLDNIQEQLFRKYMDKYGLK